MVGRVQMKQWWRRRLHICLGVAGLACTVQLQSQQGANPERTAEAVLPLSTELVAPLSARGAHPGALVVAKATQGWVGPGCTLSRGAIVSGHVVDVQLDSQAKTTRLGLLFDHADCNGKAAVAYPLQLFAVIAPPEQPYDRNSSEQGGLFTGVERHAAPATTQRGVATLTEILNSAQKGTEGGAWQAPKVLSLNGVYGLGGMTLQQDADLVATLKVQQKNLRLGFRTTLILISGLQQKPVPKAAETKDHTASAGSPPAVATKATETAPSSAAVQGKALAHATTEESVVCAAGCTIATAEPGPTSSLGGSARPVAALDMTKLGYGRADRRELTAFHHSYALAFLGADRLLLTFDLHKMRLRVTDGLAAEYVHTVRAVLIDVRHTQVLRVVDWQVRGEDQYLWPVGRDHVLVHLGTELHLLDADLVTQRTFPVQGGVLQWVAVSPLGAVLAVGVLQEQHTAEVHARLTALSILKPEEKTGVTLLDAELQPLRSAVQSSSAAPLVLLDTGELQVRNEAGDRWRLDQALFSGGLHRIAEVHSDCEPAASVPSEGLVFATGCSAQGNWYRVVRLDGGSTVLRGTRTWQQIEEAAAGANGAFAVRVVRTAATASRQGRLRADGMTGEELGVYSSGNGRRLFDTVVQDVPLTEQSFALSADGRTLAVLGLHGVSLYNVSQER